MTRPRCPRCEFSYAWDGEYCGHCRCQRPARKHWEQFRELSAFRGVSPTSRQLILFAAGCTRRLWHLLTDPPVRSLVEAAERYADDPHTPDLEVAVSRLATAPEAGGRGGAPPTAEMIACNTIHTFAVQWLHEPRAVDATTRRLAASIQAAAGQIECPDRDLLAFDLPPELEQYRAVVREWYETPIQTRPGVPRGAGESQAFQHLHAARADYDRQRRDRTRAEEAAQCDLFRDVIPYPHEPLPFDPAWRTSTVGALAQQLYASRDFSPMPILADALQDAGCEDPIVLGHCRAEKPHVRGCWVVDSLLADRPA